LSFFVPQTEDNILGTVGSHHAKNDSWLLSAKIERALYNDAELFFHSMVITGYDNDAITTDEEGQTHKGLLTLRSSWGKDVGDQGDFYMSYDYFRVLVLEAQQIVVA
jgi:C1A family cysteine protease